MTKTKKKPKKIGEFEGSPVVGTTLILRNTGDGLSQAMEIDPVKMKVGEVVNLVIEAEVVGIRHDAAKDDDESLVRVHILRAGISKIVNAELVAGVLEEQRIAIEKLTGVERLPFDGKPEGMTDEEWEKSAPRQPLDGPTPIGDLAKQAEKSARQKGAAGGEG